MKATLIGIKCQKNKKGVDAYNLYVSLPYSDYEASNAESALGQKTDSYYTVIDCKGLKPGDNINLEFEPGFEGKATLSGVHLAK